MEFVYHVVTERPMSLGQKIIFNEEHHNGVYNRVMTCKRIINGEKVDGDVCFRKIKDTKSFGILAK